MDAHSAPPAAKVGAVFLVAAAVANLALTRSHFEPHVLYGNVRGGSGAYGTFFLAASVVGLVLAVVLMRRPGPRTFRAGVVVAASLAVGWLIARAMSTTLVPPQISVAGAGAALLEFVAIALLLIALPIGAGGRRRPRFVYGWAIVAGAGFVLLFLLATGSIARVPFDMSKQEPVPWVAVDSSNGFGFLSPWLSIAFTRHVVFGASVAMLSFAIVAGALLAVTVGLAVGLARDAGARRPHATTVAAIAPALVTVPTCCGASLPLGATLAGTLVPWSIVTPWMSATPWILVATVALLSVNLVFVYRRWRAALRDVPAPAAGPPAAPLAGLTNADHASGSTFL